MVGPPVTPLTTSGGRTGRWAEYLARRQMGAKPTFGPTESRIGLGRPPAADRLTFQRIFEPFEDSGAVRRQRVAGHMG